MAKKRKQKWVEIDLDPSPPKEAKPLPVQKIKPYRKEISLNAGHDWVEVLITDKIPPEVHMVFSGSNFLTTKVVLQYDEDARNLGAALTEAAINISRSRS